VWVPGKNFVDPKRAAARETIYELQEERDMHGTDFKVKTLFPR